MMKIFYFLIELTRSCQIISGNILAITQTIDDFMNNWIINVLFTGVVTSLIASVFFYIMLLKVKPKIKFGNHIAYCKKNGENDYYQIKIKNISRRPAIDIKVELKLVVRRRIPNGYINTTINLPMQKSQLSILDVYNKNEQVGHFTINFNISEENFIENVKKENSRKNIFTPDAIDKLENHCINLSELTFSEIRCYIVVTNPFSNTTKISKKIFFQEDIRNGTYKAGSLDIHSEDSKNIINLNTNDTPIYQKVVSDYTPLIQELISILNNNSKTTKEIKALLSKYLKEKNSNTKKNKQ